jgi:hypothetical protein
MENRILRAEKDEENSCVVVTSVEGQDWVSCAECRIGEVACNYLKSKWGVDPCLYRKGVRLGRGLEPDPRDVVRIIKRNIAIYMNMMGDEGPLLKAERDMVEGVLRLETEQLERARGMLYGSAKLK